MNVLSDDLPDDLLVSSLDDSVGLLDDLLYDFLDDLLGGLLDNPLGGSSDGVSVGWSEVRPQGVLGMGRRAIGGW